MSITQKASFSFLFLCLLVFQAKAQSTFLTVTDISTLEPLEGATVLVKVNDADTQGSLTDVNGKTKLPARWEWVEVQYVGYETLRLTPESLLAQKYKVGLEPSAISLDEVVVVAGKFEQSSKDVPFSIASIQRESIALQNPQTSADLLLQTGKVFVQKSQMGGGSPNLRGFEANKVMIVLDGVRMNNAIYRGGHLQNVVTIDPNMVEKTEVLFGPGSVLYGSDALGGVMHFYSRRPHLGAGDKPVIKGNAFGRFATANQEKTGHIDLNVGFKKWGLLSSFTISDFDDLLAGKKYHKDYPNFGMRPDYAIRINGKDSIIQNENPNLQRFSGYRQYDFMQKLFFLQNKHIKHDFNFQYSTSSDVPRYDRLTERRDGQLRRTEWFYGPQERLFAAYKLNLFADQGVYDQMTITTAYQDIKESRHTRSFGNDWRNDRREQVRVLSANLDATKAVGGHEFAYGLEAAWNDVQSEAERINIVNAETLPLDTRYPDGGSDMTFLAAYVGDTWKINPYHTLKAGLRYTSISLESRFVDKSFFPFLQDSISQVSGAFSSNLGWVWNDSNGWRIALLGATGFRAPNVDDVGKTFDSQPGMVIVPNPDLKPEYTYNAELTLGKSFEDRVRLSATGWYTYYDNALVVRDFSFEGQDSILYEGVMSKVQANTNAKRAIITGVSGQVEWKIYKSLKLNSTLTYTYGQDISSDIPLDHIPPLFGRTGISFKGRRLDLEGYALYNGWKRIDRYSPNGEDNQAFATADGMPSWATINFKGTYAFTPNIRLQIGMENLLDVHYRLFASGISAPGRNLILAVRARF